MSCRGLLENRSNRRHITVPIAVLIAVGLLSGAANARAQTAQGAAAADSAAAPPPKPAPYSLPWQLRPAAVGTVVRSDTAFAFYEPPAGAGGFAVASMLLGSYKLTPELAPLVRLGVVGNSPPSAPGGPGGGTSFLNPALGATYLFGLSPDFRLAAFLGLTLPVGSGGGSPPDAKTAAANSVGILARSAMDNAMFAVDYLTVFPGLDLAYVSHGFTAQVEVTLLELMRVRGKGTPPGADAARTNFTTGLHLGYFFIPELSAGAELRYQRWLSTPALVKANGKARDVVTAAVGLRCHLKLSEGVWLRPGLAYARGLDDPMDAADYDIVQLDLPLSF